MGYDTINGNSIICIFQDVRKLFLWI
jgi:hypothetical protein